MKYLLVAISCLLNACVLQSQPSSNEVRISIIGTNDVHGEISETEFRGGLTQFSGIVAALRAARAVDGGAVLLVDAGDMWQGTLDSNLGEGAAVVAAYNALGYDAVAVGNHEFDFGPVGPDAIPSSPDADPRGALKARAREAQFPLLAANLIDRATGQPVDWPNVMPAVTVDVGGIRVGVIGVMTANALRVSIAANVIGLEVASLADSITRESQKLRDSGAQLVVVTAHAGGECSDFSDPFDVSSCNADGEIFDLANALPEGLVDHIVAGHVHRGIAHVVNGISITSSYSNAYAFSRTDIVVNRETGRIVDRKIFAPQPMLDVSRYEGKTVEPDASVVAIADQARKLASVELERTVGITLAAPFTLDGNPESTLGNLFTDALLESFDVDVAIHNVAGGLRTNMPAGELRYETVYKVFPFDNRVVAIDISGAELRQVVAEQARRGGRSMGFSGMRVDVRCEDNSLFVNMVDSNGRVIVDDDNVAVLVSDYLALGGDSILDPIIPVGGFAIDSSMPLTRDVFEAWLRRRGGTLHPQDFSTNEYPKWNRPEVLPMGCRLPP